MPATREATATRVAKPGANDDTIAERDVVGVLEISATSNCPRSNSLNSSAKEGKRITAPASTDTTTATSTSWDAAACWIVSP